MAQNDIPAQEPLSKKSLTPLRFMEELLDLLFTTQNHQLVRIARIADSYPILRAQIHAWHVDDVKRMLGILLVVPLNGPLQLCQSAQFRVALQLLLAFAAGENELALPGCRICFGIVLHPARLDAGFL